MRKARQTARFRKAGLDQRCATKVFTRAAASLLLMACAEGGAQGATSPCDIGPAAAAASNAHSLNALSWAPFGRPEIGWAIYAPLIAQEIHTACTPASRGFADQLTKWQHAHGLPDTGALDLDTFTPMKQIWQERRPFVAASRTGCPPPPAESSLA
jgi:hypothetical protein